MKQCLRSEALETIILLSDNDPVRFKILGHAEKWHPVNIHALKAAS
jgi:hypothetical protein